MKKDRTRLFMGFDLSGPVRTLLEEEIKHLKWLDEGVIKWVSPQNLHVTFIFLGSVSFARISEIQRQMKQVTAGFSPFTFQLKEVGFFPTEHFFRIVYRKIEETSQKLQEMYREMKQVLLGLAITVEERSFLPHVTLGRLRHARKSILPLVEEIKQVKDEEAKWQVSGLTLFQSLLKGPEPCYERLSVSPFVSKVKN